MKRGKWNSRIVWAFVWGTITVCGTQKLVVANRDKFYL